MRSRAVDAFLTGRCDRVACPPSARAPFGAVDVEAATMSDAASGRCRTPSPFHGASPCGQRIALTLRRASAFSRYSMSSASRGVSASTSSASTSARIASHSLLLGLDRGGEQRQVVEPGGQPAGLGAARLQLGQHRLGARDRRRRHAREPRDGEAVAAVGRPVGELRGAGPDRPSTRARGRGGASARRSVRRAGSARDNASRTGSGSDCPRGSPRPPPRRWRGRHRSRCRARPRRG